MYGLAVRWHKRHYETHPNEIKRLPVPVVVIGNLVAGGAGKTPVCIALVQYLIKQGKRPGLISRGYGRRTSESIEVTPNMMAMSCGDEPLLLKQKTNVPVVVGSNRFDAGTKLLALYPEVDILVLDDGLQHRQLHADVRIVVFDERGLGNGWFLPAGPLREKWPTNHYQEDFVLLQSHLPPSNGHSNKADLSASLKRYPPLGIFQVQRSLSRIVYSPSGEKTALDSLSGIPSIALAGIANPHTFFNMLIYKGICLKKTLSLPDHYDMKQLNLASLSSYPQWFITEKDSVKLFPILIERLNKLPVDAITVLPKIWAVPLELEMESSFFTCLDKKLSLVNGHTTS
jgi:tetraacyldisaccharide 4'-kinase